MKTKSNKSMPNLYLSGFMGVGKSALGRRVARELKMTFLDSDDEIERRVGQTIPEIFATQGESHFRDLERVFVENLHPKNGCVVSLGGGLVIAPGMMDALKKRGVVVSLFASIETILERTSRNANRPLLNVEDREARIRSMLAEREPIYMSASACITTEGRAMSEVVQHLIRTYRNSARAYLKSKSPGS